MIVTKTIDTNRLWDDYKQRGSTRARETLIEHYAWLAKIGADRVHIPPTPMFSRDDLYGHAVIGLIDAVEKYDPGMGRPFEAYASLRIKGAVLDAVRSIDWLPRTVRQNETRLREAMSRYEATFGRSPTDEELCRELAISPTQLDELLAATNASAIQSLDQLIMELGDLNFCGDSANNYGKGPEACAEDSQVRTLLQKAIEELPENERTTVALYYFEEMTLKEIGKVLGVTESRACQLHTKAILKLQTRLACWLDVLYMAA